LPQSMDDQWIDGKIYRKPQETIGKSTGNHWSWGFPVFFPSNQSIEMNVNAKHSRTLLSSSVRVGSEYLDSMKGWIGLNSSQGSWYRHWMIHGWYDSEAWYPFVHTKLAGKKTANKH
jgi:hypothetical protein